MTYQAVDPSSVPTTRRTLAPYVFGCRSEVWSPILGGQIDEITSDPFTLNALSHLIAFTNPTVIVEVGTYRGLGTAVMAETLRLYELDGHIWSCDPVDYQVQSMLEHTELADKVTLIQGGLEELVQQLRAPIDFCYIDASHKDDPGIRLRYTRLALNYMNGNGLIAIDDTNGGWPGAKTLRRMADLYLPQRRGLVLITT